MRRVSRVRRPAIVVVLTCLCAAAPAAAKPKWTVPDLRIKAGELSGTLSRVEPGLDVLEGRRVLMNSLNEDIEVRTAAGWQQSTKIGKITSGKGWVATRFQTESKEHTGTLLMRRRGDRVLGIEMKAAGPGVEQVRVRFDGGVGRAWGFGQRSNRVDQSGGTVENYVADGPWSKDAFPVAKIVVPLVGRRSRADATYYPVPWMLSSRGYGVLVDDDVRSLFDLRGRRWSVTVDGPQAHLRVFGGGTPAQVLRRFTAAVGRQPAPPAPWAFGPWLQTGQQNAPPVEDEQADLQRLRAADAPVSAAETQVRYLPCGLDRGLDEYERGRIDHYHRNGLATLSYVNPMVCRDYYPEKFEAAAAAGGLLSGPDGSPTVFDSFVGGTGPAGFTIQKVGEFDFTTASGRGNYHDTLARMIGAGHDGWMEDFGEYTPLDARASDGSTGIALHNRYPTDYHCGVARVLRERGVPRPIVRFVRSGWTGTARCVPLVWGGDPATDWGFDGLQSVVTQALSIGMSGVSRWGSDIGGYDTIATDPKLSNELLQRWIEVGAFSGVMRMKKSGIALPSYVRPQVWDPANIRTWRKYTKLRTQLYPYIAAADAEYRRTGMPIMRHLALGWPRDKRAFAADDQFAFGDDLIVAPVLRKGARARKVYLPRGRWVDLRRSLRYAAGGDGAFDAGRAIVVRGGRHVRSGAALSEVPLYARAGTVLPLLSADVSTLSDYAGAVRLADRRDRLRLVAFPARGRRSFGLFGGRERIVSTVRGRRSWTLRIDGARRRTYDLRVATGLLGFRPRRATIGGRRVTVVRGAAAGTVRLRFATQRGTLRVTG